MHIQNVIYLIITFCNLVNLHVAEEDDVTFKNVIVQVNCRTFNTYSSNAASKSLRIKIPHSKNLAQELKKVSPTYPVTSCILIDYQHIPVIYKNALSDVDVKIMYITNCRVSHIEPGFLQHASIQELFLEGNTLGTITRDMFQGASQLRELYLPNNSINCLEKGAFEDAPTAMLDLSHNDLRDIPLGVFDNMYKASGLVLILSMNKIKQVAKGTFSNSSLVTIALDYNLIETIEPGAFENTPDLRSIRLGRNKLTKISSGIFHGFKRSPWGLRCLDLSMNEIEYIETGAFTNSSIEFLNLSHNKLKEIKNETFSGSKIKSLTVNITEGTFQIPQNIDGVEKVSSG